MPEESAFARRAALISARTHPADFSASRADYILARLRSLALVLALLLPLWAPVDYLLLPFEDFVILALARLLMGGLALALYLLTAETGRLPAALTRLALLLMIPALFYAIARLQLGAHSGDFLYGYAFFPVLIAAMLAIFPLTLREGAVCVLALLGGYAALELLQGTLAEPRWLSMLWLLVLVALIGLWAQLSQLRMLLDLSWRATRDPLTGVLNRRSLGERLAAEHARWDRYGRPLALLQVELRGYDGVVAEHGQAVADRLQTQLAELIDRSLRPTDVLGRWAADNLLAILPETDGQTAEALAARVREVAELASVPLAGTTVRGQPRVVVTVPAPRESLAQLQGRLEQGGRITGHAAAG